MTEKDVNPSINNDPMEKETTLSITPRIIKPYQALVVLETILLLLRDIHMYDEKY